MATEAGSGMVLSPESFCCFLRGYFLSKGKERAISREQSIEIERMLNLALGIPGRPSAEDHEVQYVLTPEAIEQLNGKSLREAFAGCTFSPSESPVKARP